MSTMILGIRYSVGLGPDESKNNLFLSPFFKNISSLKVQCDAELWSFHPNLLFCINLKEISRIQQKNEKNQHGARKEPMSQHCFIKFPMSRHTVEKVLKIWKCRNIS